MKKLLSQLLIITILGGLCSFSAFADQADTQVCKHNILILTGKKSATWFQKGYTGNKVCKNCKITVKKGKHIGKLRLKKPKINVNFPGNKLKVKYYKVKDATGFQLKYYEIKDYKIDGNNVTEIKGKTVTRNYNTKKTVTKSFRCSGSTYKVLVRAFVKKNGEKSYSNWNKVHIGKAKTCHN